jgi:PAS domain S-box-containing protein
MKTGAPSSEHESLRDKAEGRLKSTNVMTSEGLQNMSSEDIAHLVHELRVHQIELEMQNEELRATQASLEESRQQYSDLYNNAPVGSCTVGEEGVITECNLTLAVFLRVSQSMLIDKPLSKFIHRDDQDNYYLHSNQCFAERRPLSFELKLKTDEGSFFWAHLFGIITGGPEGTSCCRITVTDITEKKDAEARQIALFNEVSDLKLALDQHTLTKAIDPRSKILDGVAIGIWEHDLTSDVLTFDETMYKLYGLNKAEFPDARLALRHAIHPDDFAKLLQEKEMRIGHGDSRFDVEFRVIHQPKKIRHIYSKTFVERNTLGTPIRISGIEYDVTEKKSQELFYRQAISALDASALVATTDRAGTITGANDLFCEISGYSREELIGENHRIVNSGFHEKSVFKQMWSTISSGDVWIGELRNKRKDGTYYWVHTTINPIKNEDGEVESYIAVRFDITERKESLAQLSFVSKLTTIGELAAGLGHEINNPLAIVDGNLRAIQRNVSPEILSELNIDKKIGAALLGSERIRDVVRGFRSFSTVDSELNESVSTRKCVESTIGMVEGIFRSCGVNFKYVAEGTDYIVLGSSGRLQQVLMNLFVNAKYALEGQADALIHVSLEAHDSLVTIEVSDNGPGIPAEILSKIWDPFFTTKPSGKGSGLGLAISTKMIQEMGGQLELVSSNESGTTFRIKLPWLKPANQSEAISSSVPLPEENFKMIRALVVDDEKIIRELATEILEDYGLSDIREAENGLQALDFIKSETFDLVLTDLKMPVMGGLDLIKAIDKLALARRPHIAIVTGADVTLMKSEDREDARNLVNSVVLKPFEDWELVRVLKAVKKMINNS